MSKGKYAHWTKEEIDCLGLEYPIANLGKLSVKLGRTYRAICNKAFELKLHRPCRGLKGGGPYPRGNLDAVLYYNTGLTPKVWQDIFDGQQGYCKICGIHQSELHRRFDADHNKKTGQRRGLLCGNCNKMIGLAKENTETLQKAIQYLRSYQIE